ncbi:hypothetical protein U1P98_03080 [Lysinibacillus irui]|uniref:Uncharacterized protein n=1 Tax=Lysinibacillus irui TaxID=2998077 RepID=A0ABU5NGV5_9BACI|nr:hypothetical protein [Lysinibacillus irui]MEA0553788.1 hypothetical protein [Lysinibacillus irui]MEA0975270.1 hypothetical protein [Lysinibacillus irui]MEA1041424.1 hypothetical protein [Lysinibacillus irui]
MTHFEYMEQQGQLTIFDFLSVQESDHKLNVDRLPSTDVNKTVDKTVDKKNAIIESRIRVCIVRR